VLEVRVEDRVLIASDGSLAEPLRIRADEPARAAIWLFRHVRQGHWLKLRNVEPDSNWSGAAEAGAASGSKCLGLQVSAAMITRMPTWCFDVTQRAQRLGSFNAPAAAAPVAETAAEASGSGSTTVDAGQQESLAVAVSPPSSASASTVVAELPIPVAAETTVSNAPDAIDSRSVPSAPTIGAAHANPPVDAAAGLAGTGGITAEDAAGSVSTPVVNRKLLEERSTAASVDTELDAEEKSNAGQERSPQKRQQVRLTTVYHADGSSASRLSDLRLAADSGVRCHVLGGFAVATIEPFQAETLVSATCRACGHSFAWQRCHRDADLADAKRRRLALPCGHWMFGLAANFSLELYDLEDHTIRVSVSVRDEQGDFLGLKPDLVACDATAQQRVLSTLLQLTKGGPEQDHLLAVARVDGKGHSASGAYVVCDSKAEWVDVA